MVVTYNHTCLTYSFSLKLLLNLHQLLGDLEDSLLTQYLVHHQIKKRKTKCKDKCRLEYVTIADRPDPTPNKSGITCTVEPLYNDHLWDPAAVAVILEGFGLQCMHRSV